MLNYMMMWLNILHNKFLIKISVHVFVMHTHAAMRTILMLLSNQNAWYIIAKTTSGSHSITKAHQTVCLFARCLASPSAKYVYTGYSLDSCLQHQALHMTAVSIAMM